MASFPPGSAPCPSGPGPCHLRDCLSKPGQASSLLLAIVALVAGAVEGKFPLGLALVWCASNLIPLSKKDGGVRPIAVGDTFRRLAGKVLLRVPPVQTQSARIFRNSVPPQLNRAKQLTSGFPSPIAEAASDLR